MERDPLRYVWTHSRGRHGLAVLLVLLLVPLLWLSLELVRALADDAALGRAFAGGRSEAPLLALAVPLPQAFGGRWTLFEGIPLGRDAFFMAGCAGLAGLLVLRAAIGGGLRSLGAGIAVDLGGRLRATLLDRILAARPAAKDEATGAADLVGRGVTGVMPFFGRAMIAPLLAGAEIVVALVFAAMQSLWLALAMLVAVIATLAVLPWRERAETQALSEATRVARDASGFARETVRRLPAIRAHGTADTEARAFAARLASGAGRVRAALRRHVGAWVTMDLACHAALAILFLVGVWLVMRGSLTPGGLLATVAAGLLLPEAGEALARWMHERQAGRAIFEELARTLGSLQARTVRRELLNESPTLARQLVLTNVSALDPRSGQRLGGINLTVPLPSHVAFVGGADEGGTTLAAVLGGALDASGGAISADGVDLARVSAPARARRIAYVGSDPVLLDASLRENLLYGVERPDGLDAGALDERLARALTVAGLDGTVYGLGLANTVDPAREPRLAAAVVDARARVQAALAAEGIAGLVDPFDPARYNRHATLAENLLFGVPVGDTFGEAHLAAHPFLRAVLEAEDLTKPLAEMGMAIAQSMVEIFSGIPDGHPLFARFSFFTAGERGFYEDLVARRNERRRGNEAGHDRDRLIQLALRYVESRHRLGLLDGALEARIVGARNTFAKLLPASLRSSVEFYDPGRLCAAASLSDNLLFGRIAHDVAGAEERVRAASRRVLAAQGLDQDVFRLGLSARLTARDGGFLALPPVAIDLARCLAREPQMLVVDRIFEGLGVAEAEALAARLHAAMSGRSLIVVVPAGIPLDGFATVLRFSRGALVDEAAVREPEPA